MGELELRRCDGRHRISRRGFLAGLSALAAASAFGTTTLAIQPPRAARSLFRLSVLTDEITQDFGKALEIAAREFGLSYVDLRLLWGKNIVDLEEKQIAEARALLKRYDLRVSCIASPLYKVDWPGAPTSKFSPKQGKHKADSTLGEQSEVLKRALQLARTFETDSIRCFDFWRLEDPKPYRAAIDEKLREAAREAQKQGVKLLLENEHACNTATAAESVRTLQAVPEPNFQLIWDPGNAFAAGETPFPDGYSLLPKNRIGYMHCKDAQRKPDGKAEFTAMGRGVIDYVGQFRALAKDGFRGPVVLETHWKGAGSAEESTRQSMAGMKQQLEKAGAFQEQTK